MLTLLFALCLFQDPSPAASAASIAEANAAARFKTATETSFEERGYSQIRYDLARMRTPVQIRVHKDLGCLVLFDRPYDDSWAADAGGSGAAGAYYSYQEWGVTPDAAQPSRRGLIIRNVAPAAPPVNLFFQFGEQALEILILPVDGLAEADRVVRFSLEPKPAPPPTPKPVMPRLEEKNQSWERYLALLTQDGNRTKRTPHGQVIYNFKKPPYFVFFKPAPHSPPQVALEAVRGVRKWNGTFKYEFPVPAERVEVDGQTLLILPNFAMSERRERLYLRSQVQGERNATFVKLGRGPRAGGKR